MTTTERHELLAWLGPAGDELTAEQVDRLSAIADNIATRYPDPDEQEYREIALTTAVQYLLHDNTPEQVRTEYAQARYVEARAKAAAVQMALMLDADGSSEVQTAEQVGINRLTLRRAKGLS